METKAHNVAVGAFILAGILALVVVVIWLGRGQFGDEYAYYETAFTESVAGLKEDAVVRYNGVDVGHVKQLQLDRNDPKRVIVRLEVPRDLAIREDSVAIVESEGLTGANYVEIEGGSPGAPAIMPRTDPPYPVIASKPSFIQEIKEAAPKLVNRLDAVADRASDLLNAENRKAIAHTLANLTVASDRLNQVLTTTDDTVKRVGQLSANVDGIVAEARGEIKQSLEQLHQTLATIDKAAKGIDRLSTSADDVVTASKAQIAESGAELNQLLVQSRSLVQNLTRLVNDIERQPTVLLFGDRRQGYKPR